MKITATELRIGNYVLYREHIFIISMIRDNNEVQITNSQTKEVQITTEISAISPIPLTEGWLLKLQLQPKGIRWVCGDFELCQYSTEAIYYINSKGKELELKHVHKLQNLFYSLQEEELIIKN